MTVVKKIRVGIDSYCLVSTDLDAVEILEWTKSIGGEGVQFTGIDDSKLPGGRWDTGSLKELASHAKSLGLYLEWGGAPHIPFDLSTGQAADISEAVLRTAREAAVMGAGIVRSCSGGLMRWNPSLPVTEKFLEGMVAALGPLLPELEDLGVTLALETHFEFTTWELLRVFDALGVQPGGPLGICLDTMNLLVMLEDPIKGLDRVLPWVVATHAKDGCIIPSDDGFRVFTMGAGTGLIPWEPVMARLRTLAGNVNLSVEDHGGAFDIPYLKPMFLSRFPDLSAAELASLQRLAAAGRDMVRRGEAEPVARPDWPGICMDRTAEGVRKLKEIEEMGRVSRIRT